MKETQLILGHCPLFRVVKVQQERGVVEVYSPSGKSDTPKKEFAYDAVYGAEYGI